MNLTQMIAAGLTLLLSIGAIGAFIAKYAGKAKKYLHIASEALSLLDTVVSAVEDKTITDAEIVDIKAKAEALMADIKAK